MASILREFIRRPGSIGAVSPSSALLGRRMTEWIEWDSVSRVVEYGPGTGAITDHIAEAMSPDGRYIGIELNADFYRLMGERHPELHFVNGSVENVVAICDREGMDSLDAIISGLPWAVFPQGVQESVVRATVDLLRPGGQFVTFAYLQGVALPAGQRFGRLLHEQFGQVERSPIVWRNFPPAFVYRCRKR